MSRLLVFVSLFLTINAAQAQRYAPIIHPIGMAEKIVIRGFKGALQIVPTESRTLKVEAEKKGGSEGWNFEVRQKQNEWEVRVKSSVEQEGWDKLRSGSDMPTFDMKITAPLKAIEVFWHSGQVFAENWDASLSLQMTKGKAQFKKGQGPLKVQLIEGQIEVLEHKGNIALQTFKGQVLLQKNEGALALNNHSATYTISDHTGPLDYRNHSGTTNITKFQGSGVIKNASGAVRLRDYQGSFQAEMAKGSLDAKVGEVQNFSVTSDDAAITLDVPRESGALVILRSEKGRLWAPNHLRKIKKGRWTERKGRLKGKQQGHIKIVSKYGDIVLK